MKRSPLPQGIHKSEVRKERMRNIVAYGLLGVIGPGVVCGVGELIAPQVVNDSIYHATGQRSPLEERLSRAMSAFAGVTMRVRCEAPPGSTDKIIVDGNTVTNWPHTTRIRPDICRVLATSVIDNHTPTISPSGVRINGELDNDVATAVLVVTHEPEHQKHPNEENEEAIQCSAWQEMPEMVRLLGGAPELGERLQSFAASHIIRYDVQSVDCVPAGYLSYEEQYGINK